MENKVLEKNIDRLKQYDKKLVDIILTTDDIKSNLALAQTACGEYNVLLDGVPLHNQEGAIEEAKKIVSLIENKEEKNAIRIVYGFGLGYLVDEMSEVIKGKIIVYEPDTNLLRLILSIAQVDAIFKDNVIVCSDKKTFSKHVSAYANPDCILTLNVLPSYKEIYKEDIKEIAKIAQRAKGETQAMQNTYMRSAPISIRNSFLNLKYIFQNPCISDLKDIYKGKTALCLSAGPSLRKNIELIKENADKCVIFAVNPTIKLLKEYNIKPDFVVAVETCDVSHQLRNAFDGDYYLITEGFTNYNVLRIKSKKTISYLAVDNFMNYWLRDCLGLKDNLKTQGTVSYTAFMSAYIMGFDKIILCGQDLAYSDGECYAKGSQFENLKCVYNEEQKKYVIETDDFEKYVASFKTGYISEEHAINTAKANIDFLNKNLYTVKSQDGKDIPTQTGYALFIDWFSRASDEIKEQKPNIKLINSSTGGAQIDGFENIPLIDALSGEHKIERVDLSGYTHSFDKKHALEKVNLMFDELTKFKSMLEELKEINNKTVKEIEIKKTHTPNIIKMLQKHEDLIYKVLNEKDNNVIRNAILIFLNEYVKVMDKDYYTDLSVCKETINKITQITEDIIAKVDSFLQGLADCKPFILQ